MRSRAFLALATSAALAACGGGNSASLPGTSTPTIAASGTSTRGTLNVQSGDGAPLELSQLFNGAVTALTTTPKGVMYVADGAGLATMTTSGAYTYLNTSFGPNGAPLGQITSLAYNQTTGALYAFVFNSAGNAFSAVKISTTGTVLDTVPVSSYGEPYTAIAVDGTNDRVYFVGADNVGNAQLVVVDFTANTVTPYALGSTNPIPNQIAIANNVVYWVLEPGSNYAIGRFDLTTLAALPAYQLPTGDIIWQANIGTQNAPELVADGAGADFLTQPSSVLNVASIWHIGKTGSAKEWGSTPPYGTYYTLVSGAPSGTAYASTQTALFTFGATGLVGQLTFESGTGKFSLRPGLHQRLRSIHRAERGVLG